jgi:hypothetical protein
MKYKCIYPLGITVFGRGEMELVGLMGKHTMQLPDAYHTNPTIKFLCKSSYTYSLDKQLTFTSYGKQTNYFDFFLHLPSKGEMLKH